MRYIKVGDIIRIIMNADEKYRKANVPKNLITEVSDVFTRKGPWGGVFVRVRGLKYKTSCSVSDVALVSSKGMRFQYLMQGPFIDD